MRQAPRLETRRAFWNGVDVDLTPGEYKLVHLLATNAGSFVTYRSLYDRLQIQGFIAGKRRERLLGKHSFGDQAHPPQVLRL